MPDKTRQAGFKTGGGGWRLMVNKKQKFKDCSEDSSQFPALSIPCIIDTQ